MEKTIYGADLLISLDGKQNGHASSHTLTLNAETRELIYKKVSTAPIKQSRFKDKEVTYVNFSISFSGMCFYEDTEADAASLMASALEGAVVPVKSFIRGNDAAPLLSGNAIITNIQMEAPADGNVTYSGTLESTGEFAINEANLAKAAAANEG